MAENNKRLVAAGSAIFVLAAAAGTAALFLREHNAQARQADILQKELAQGPTVRAARVEMAAADRVVSLPAEVRAEMHATLYAKVSGYVKEVTVDKGDRVSKGQVVAVLESPDLDEQLRSAEAELSLRKQQLARALRLVGSGYVSHDQREQLEEAVKVAQANVVRARVQKDYQLLRAPFDGTVTARYADPGSLLPAATGSTSSAQPLLVRTGDAVTLQLAPDQPAFQARVSRIAESLDLRTRTMLCEIDLPHPPRGLYPGAFVETTLALRGAPRPLVPTEALVGQSGQLFVALIEENKIHFQHVKLGVDDGARVEVLDGLRGGELVALNLAPDVADGSSVRIRDERPKTAR